MILRQTRQAIGPHKVLSVKLNSADFQRGGFDEDDAARVIERLGDIELVTTHEIEGLFAVDLAYLQDFYGVINFGSDADIDSMLAAQGGAEQPADEAPAAPAAAVDSQSGPSGEAGDAQPDRPQGRRSAIEEVPAGPR